MATGGGERRQARIAGRIQDSLAGHAQLRALCDRLEALADGLPALPPEAERRALAQDLLTLPSRHRREEGPLCEALLTAGHPQARGHALRHALAARIRSQRVTDLVQAQDLAAALAEAGEGDGPALGYMLRCFFLACRRALAFEELAVLHLGGDGGPELEAAIGAALAPRSDRMD